MSAMDGVVPWRERITDSIARSRKIRGGNYVQLATVDANNAPRCRTVVFRGFAPDGRLKIITDQRSAKVKESRRVEVCWWFSQSSEQYRFAGELDYVGADHPDAERVALRKQQWGNLSDGAREQFFWKHPPRAAFDATPEDVPAGGLDTSSPWIVEGYDARRNFTLDALAAACGDEVVRPRRRVAAVSYTHLTLPTKRIV